MQLAAACSGIVDLMTVTQDAPSAVMTCTIHAVKIDVFIHTSDEDSACIDDDDVDVDDRHHRHGHAHHHHHHHHLGLPKRSSSSRSSISPLHAMWEDIVRASGLMDTTTATAAAVVMQREKWQLVSSTYSDPSTDPYYNILVDAYGGFKASINGTSAL